jgi:hypothetical protein
MDAVQAIALYNRTLALNMAYYHPVTWARPPPDRKEEEIFEVPLIPAQDEPEEVE